MNPFDLRGPEFLLFYAALAAAVIAFTYARRRSDDPGGFPSRVDDPYQLAALRAGPGEATRVAVLSLLDRRLVKARDGALQAIAGADLARRPVERAVLSAFASPRPASDAFGDPGVQACTAGIDAELRAAGLVAEDPGAVSPRALVAGGLLLAVAATKLLVALSRGRSNVGFLVLAGLVLPLLAVVAGSRPRRTLKGEKALELAERAFGRLKRAAPSLVPGGRTNELTLAFAVFGASVLPPLARDLMSEAGLRRVPQGGASSCGGSSSCGSASCGGGCGGGGCGGCGS